MQQPRHVRGGEARGALGRGGDDDLVVALVRDQLEQRVAVGAAALDPAVDRDARARRRLLDGLEQRQGEFALARQRGVERQVQRDRRQVGGDERGVLGPGDAQRRVERGLRQRAADDREQDPGAAVRMPAVPAAGGQRDRAAARPPRPQRR